MGFLNLYCRKFEKRKFIEVVIWWKGSLYERLNQQSLFSDICETKFKICI